MLYIFIIIVIIVVVVVDDVVVVVVDGVVVISEAKFKRQQGERERESWGSERESE